MKLYFPKDQNQKVIRYEAWYKRATDEQKETVIEVEMPEKPEQKGFFATPKYDYEKGIGYWDVQEIKENPEEEIDRRHNGRRGLREQQVLLDRIAELEKTQADQDELFMRLLLDGETSEEVSE